MHLWRTESGKNKSFLRILIEKWMRPMFDIDVNYKNLAKHEAMDRKRIIQRANKLFVVLIPPLT
jgi:hypothetical protein